MFDGIIFTEKNLTDEDLNTISFIMRINKPMKYVELETTSEFSFISRWYSKANLVK